MAIAGTVTLTAAMAGIPITGTAIGAAGAAATAGEVAGITGTNGDLGRKGLRPLSFFGRSETCARFAQRNASAQPNPFKKRVN